jgi:hypothetical protein
MAKDNAVNLRLITGIFPILDDEEITHLLEELRLELDKRKQERLERFQRKEQSP